MADARRPTNAFAATVAAALSTTVIPGIAGAQSPVMSVRNTAPEQAVAPEAEQWPIYYPHLAHRLGAAATTDEILLRQLLDLHSAMRYDQAADVAVRIVEIDPGAPEAHYNLACMLARLHKTDAAIDALGRAVAVGWRDRDHMSLDPDLKIVRGDVRFNDLVLELERLVHQEHADARSDPDAADRGAAPPQRPPSAIAGDANQQQRTPEPTAPIILLVADSPDRSSGSDEPGRPAAGHRSRVVTMALTPTFARRLAAWLAERQVAAEALAPDTPPAGGWVVSPGSTARPAPARPADQADAAPKRS